jgi:hypothetical protein
MIDDETRQRVGCRVEMLKQVVSAFGPACVLDGSSIRVWLKMTAPPYSAVTMEMKFTKTGRYGRCEVVIKWGVATHRVGRKTHGVGWVLKGDQHE